MTGTPDAVQPAAAASDPVIAAAGDIACDPASASFNDGQGDGATCLQKSTSDLLVNADLDAVLSLGDNQYYCGGYQAFLQSYDLSWGRVKSITHPVVGNHEYLTSDGTDCSITNRGAAGYFKYFGSAAGTPGQGYYSFDVGAWHIIALNSNCGDIGGCLSGSAEYQWLQSDLATHKNFCTLAYWHIPLFSSGGRSASNSKPFWQLLYDNNADLILNGHDHLYERFAPQDAGGKPDPARGIREFIVGTGGANHTPIQNVAVNSEVRNANTYGVLRLTLHPTGYDWHFEHAGSSGFSDSGTGTCHGDTVPPTAPTGVAATSVAWNQVNLGWTASTDNVGVAGYRILRNGTAIGTVQSTSYSDRTVQPLTNYSYAVTALDAAGLASTPSNAISVSTPPIPLLFHDGFETGGLSKWNNVQGLLVQNQDVASGSFAARATSAGAGPAYAVKKLDQPQAELYYRVRFDVLSTAHSGVALIKLRNTSGDPIVKVGLDATGHLQYRNVVTRAMVTSAVMPAPGSWNMLQVHLSIADTASRIEVWYNGAPVRSLTRTDTFGTTPIGWLQLGENASGLTYDIAFDGVNASPGYIDKP